MESVNTLVFGIPTAIIWLLGAVPAVGLTIIVGRGLRLWRAQNQLIAAMDRAAASAPEHAIAR
jgi:hypothetical protein